MVKNLKISGEKKLKNRIFVLMIVLLLAVAHSISSLDYQSYGFSKFDKDGDGLIDPEVAQHYDGSLDLDGDGVFDVKVEERDNILSKFPLSCNFRKVWESEPAPGNVFDAVVEDLDNDLLKDIVFPSYYASRATLHIYENIGNNNFEEVWTSDELLSGIYTSLKVADIDKDGNKEIVAGQLNSRVRIFENIGDNLYNENDPIYFYDSGYAVPIRELVVGDSNNNGQNEVLFVQGGSGPSRGKLRIFEYVGSEQFVSIYEDQVDLYLVGMSIGNFDSDEYQDIMVTHGGFAYGEFWFDWYEYDGSSYIKRTITIPDSLGLALRTKISDVDLDGENELVVAGMKDNERVLLIFESPDNDQYELIAEVTYPSATNPMDISINNIIGSNYPEIGVSTHASGGIAQVFLFGYDGNNYNLICYTSSEIEESVGSFYSIDLTSADNDRYPDIVLAVSPPIKKAVMLEGIIKPTLMNVNASSP
ncbi:MAG: VCBS repeat-containing protein [Candidatus Woesearchaeota archaeon]